MSDMILLLSFQTFSSCPLFKTVGVVSRSYNVTCITMNRKLQVHPYIVPISNAKSKRAFSKMKRVITAFRSSSKEIRWENILRIMENETQWDDYALVDLINHLWNDKERRLKEEDGPKK